MSVYKPPGNAYINSRADFLQQLFVDFANKHADGFAAELLIDMDSLYDCVSRVHQREYYFKIFHDMPEGPSDVKRISLYCFWILKYKPFMLRFDGSSHAEKDEDSRKWERKYFLERFCIYLLTMVIRAIYKGEPRLPLSDGGIADLVYSLRHHDISKEALTELFEMLEDVIKRGRETSSQP